MDNTFAGYGAKNSGSIPGRITKKKSYGVMDSTVADYGAKRIGFESR